MTRLYLVLAGGIAAGLGLAILLFPVAFYSSYGIPVSGPNLLNELRAPGAALVAAGAFILAGSLRPIHSGASLMVAAALYLAYAFGRLVGLTLDGLPGTGLLLAGAVELVLGIAGLALWLSQRRTKRR